MAVISEGLDAILRNVRNLQDEINTDANSEHYTHSEQLYEVVP